MIVNYYYHDAYQIYELLDQNKNTNQIFFDLPNIVTAIKDLFIRSPFESRRTFLYGQTLLHKCYETPMPNVSSIIDILLEFYPEALEKEDDNGRLPIHYLLSPKSSWWQHQLHQCQQQHRQDETTSIKDLLKQIILLFPDSLVSTTSLRDGGQLPLHIVCQRTNTCSQSVEIIDFLIKCYPDACHYRDNYGKFPFDYALETAIETCNTIHNFGSPHNQILQLLLQQNPIVLSFPSSISESSGIHNNNNNEDEFGNTRSIISTTAVNNGDGGNGDLPIHRLIKECSYLYNRSKSKYYDPIINILLNDYEGCLRIQDSVFKMTPLMLSCTCNNSLTQIYTLLRKWPEQIQFDTSQIIFNDTKFNGELLYSSLAMVKSITIVDVKNWMDYYNTTDNNNDSSSSSSSSSSSNNNSIVLKKDIHGRLPIHYAVLSKSNDAYKIIHYLLFGTTEGATGTDTGTAIQQLSTADNNGRLPIHYASASPTCHENILRLLIKIYPDGLLQKDKNGRLPWHYGECSRQDLIFEMTTTLYPNHNECNLDLVPDEIQWDILSVKGH